MDLARPGEEFCKPVFETAPKAKRMSILLSARRGIKQFSLRWTPYRARVVDSIMQALAFQKWGYDSTLSWV